MLNILFDSRTNGGQRKMQVSIYVRNLRHFFRTKLVDIVVTYQ